jgi:hypothetical protein
MRYGRPLADRFFEKTIPEPNSGCLLWLGANNKKGYGSMNVDGETVLATHVALKLAGVSIKKGDFACHTCDTPGCVLDSHLFPATNAINVADKMAKGRHRVGRVHGAAHGRAKLTEEQARAILSDPRTGRAIGPDYGISFQTVSDIKRGKKWKHLQADMIAEAPRRAA